MQMSTYLSFKGDCEAAFAFHEQFLGARRGAIFRYAGSPGIPWLVNCEAPPSA
jgi:uncharacterized glyoxalase superfamily protein PhnB